MKNILVNTYMDHIKKRNNYSKEKLEKIEYGLTGLYLTFSKIIIVILIATILGIIKEVFIFMLLFNILRTVSFGLHATKSWICLISSIIFFIGLPLLAININLNIYIKAILCIISIIMFLLYAPADTKKRPIVNKTRRIKLKIISVLFGIVFFLLSIIINNNFISNSLVITMVLESILISPLTYKLFNLPYNNYIAYLQKHPELVE